MNERCRVPRLTEPECWRLLLSSRGRHALSLSSAYIPTSCCELLCDRADCCSCSPELLFTFHLHQQVWILWLYDNLIDLLPRSSSAIFLLRLLLIPLKFSARFLAADHIQWSLSLLSGTISKHDLELCTLHHFISLLESSQKSRSFFNLVILYF